ncbi:MAG: lysozyme inhibitor LprI family protein [Alphaproteobacteria bacterium]|jgi:uncharacterized protein YecT (DUF1311 family)
MKPVCALLVATTIIPALPAYAMSGRGTVCMDNMNAKEAVACLQPALSNAQEELRAKYKSVQKMLAGTPAEKQLARTQKLWENYVQETCLGLIRPVAAEQPIAGADVLACQVEFTLERTRDLDRMFYVPLHD